MDEDRNNKKKKLTVASMINNSNTATVEECEYHIGHKNRKVISYLKPSSKKDCNVMLENDCVLAGNKAPNREFFVEKTFIVLGNDYSTSNIALASNPLNTYTNAYKVYHNTTPNNLLKYVNKFKNKSLLKYMTLAEFLEEEFKIEAINTKNMTEFYIDMANDKLYDLLDHDYILVPGSLLVGNKYIREVEIGKFGATLYEVIALDAKIGEYRKYTHQELILLGVDFANVISKYGIYKRIEK